MLETYLFTNCITCCHNEGAQRG